MTLGTLLCTAQSRSLLSTVNKLCLCQQLFFNQYLIPCLFLVIIVRMSSKHINQIWSFKGGSSPTPSCREGAVTKFQLDGGSTSYEIIEWFFQGTQRFVIWKVAMEMKNHNEGKVTKNEKQAVGCKFCFWNSFGIHACLSASRPSSVSHTISPRDRPPPPTALLLCPFSTLHRFERAVKQRGLRNNVWSNAVCRERVCGCVYTEGGI